MSTELRANRYTTVSIEVRDNWLAEVGAAIDDDGLNDNEHALLVEVMDLIQEQVDKQLGEKPPGWENWSSSAQGAWRVGVLTGMR